MSDISRLKDSLTDRYAVDREIGRGGMATVYLARDVRHDRQVALKVLDSELGAVLGAERFLAEIKVTANLQHPNLLPLFDSGEAGGLLFYVMPFVEGESLRARLDREKQLPMDEAIRIATAIANALDYAHSHGVIHRDLKPENILLQAGQPVVADFGIALAVSKAGGQRITQTGLSLGTPQYMSPEQATGDRSVDGRTDIYSLGAMTYEMLTGEPPHSGTTSQAIIAKLMTEDVRPLTVLRRNVPPYVDAAVRHALEKLPADRFATAREFSEALQGRGALGTAAQTMPSAAAMSQGAPSFGAGASRSVVARLVSSRATALTGFVLAAVVTGAWWWTARRAAPPPTARFAFSAAPNQSLGGILNRTVAISPDGRTLLYSTVDSGGRQRLFIRSLDDLRQRAIPGSENGLQPFFSPDGHSVGYFDGRQIMRMQTDGGTPTPVAEPRRGMQGATWCPDGIVFSSEGKLMLVPSGGGTPGALAGNDTVFAYWPVALPGCGGVLFASQLGSSARLGIASIPGGRITMLDVQGIFPLGIVDDELVYVRDDGAIASVPFDTRRLRVSGNPIVVTGGVAVNTTGQAKAAVSTSGSLVYVSGSAAVQLVIADAHGATKPTLLAPAHYGMPRYSPDGKRVAVEVQSGGSTDVWIYELASGAGRRLTTEGGTNQRPEWTPDGKRVIFRSTRGDSRGELWWQPADGSGSAEKLVGVAGKEVYEGSLSPDGKALVYRTGTVGSADIWSRGLTGDTATKPVVATRFTEMAGRLSPDGKWLAYQSDESGHYEVYVRPFPGPGATVTVSLNGGSTPVWAPDGRRIFFVEGQKLIAASVSAAPDFSVSSRAVVVDGNYYWGAGHAGFDVARDGQSLLLLRPVPGFEEQIVVVHNWITEQRERRRGQSAAR